MTSGLHSDLSEAIIACAIEVHRHIGPGLLESVYETALCRELSTHGLAYARQTGVPVYYKGEPIAEFRPDLIVERSIILEIKSVSRFDPIFVAQMLTYLRATRIRVGLILNFNRSTLRDGIKRVSL